MQSSLAIKYELYLCLVFKTSTVGTVWLVAPCKCSEIIQEARTSKTNDYLLHGWAQLRQLGRALSTPEVQDPLFLNQNVLSYFVLLTKTIDNE